MLKVDVRSLVFSVACGVLSTGLAFGQEKLDSRVDQSLSEIGAARVIVMIAPPRIGETPSGAYSEPAEFIASILGDGGQNIQQLADLPIAVVETDRQGVGALVDNPQIAYVVADQPVSPLLHTSLVTLNVDDVHSAGTLGDGYAVAILDTGVNYDHSFFSGKLRAEGCFSTPQSSIYSVRTLCENGLDVDLTDGSGDSCEVNGCDHGTHVAGIAIGARATTADGDGISGVAPSAGLISMQVFTRFDNIRDCAPSPAPCVKSFVSDQLRALRHIRDLSASIDIASVNMSLGGGRYNAACDLTDPRTGEIARLRESEIVTVISSGNDGYFNAVGAPACIRAAVTVGASFKDRIELDVSYSNTSALVDFLAPGTGIVSATGDGYGSKSGTSMAAPHIAGLFALLKSRVPSASADALESLLRLTAQTTTAPRTGLVLYFPDAQRAVEDLATSSEGLSGGGALAQDDLNAEAFSGVVGERRILIQGGVNNTSVEATLPRIVRALGRRAIVRPLGENTYLAERQTGFSVEDLSRLMGELGPGARLYPDEPVPPSARR